MAMRTAFATAAAIAAAASTPVHAAAATDFSCRNDAAEITCSATGCEVKKDEFTPMGVSREGNRLEVCAYSGCWSGTLDLIRTRGDLTILHATLSRGQGAAAVVYNRKEKTATMLWGNFTQALSCGGSG
jgi:hypothetical protein